MLIKELLSDIDEDTLEVYYSGNWYLSANELKCILERDKIYSRKANKLIELANLMAKTSYSEIYNLVSDL